MDDCETVAYNYLTKHLGFKKVDFEPEGKGKFPDFLVDDRIDDRIAVEVRRLNQDVAPPQPGEKPRGRLEEAISVGSTIQRLLPSLGPPTGQVSWCVDIEYSQPVPERQQIERAVRRQLQAFRDGPIQNPAVIQLSDNCALKLFSAGKLYKDCFVMVPPSDYDSGGWSIPELEENLKICIEEKTARWKASGIPRTKYAEWWLVLIDLIHHGREADISVSPQVPPHNWDKIVLISPFDHTQAFEIRL